MTRIRRVSAAPTDLPLTSRVQKSACNDHRVQPDKARDISGDDIRGVMHLEIYPRHSDQENQQDSARRKRATREAPQRCHA
jgi:hypothetical protein